MNVCKITKHKLEVVVHLGETRLQRCSRCGQYQSYLFDKTLRKMVWVDGNFILDADEPVWILAGNEIQYLEAKLKLTKLHLDLQILSFKKRVFDHDKNPQLLFYGSWWENEEIEECDKELTRLLNARY